MPRYTEADIFHFQCRARSLGMSAPDSFFNAPTPALTSICNGIGGDGSPFGDALTLIYHRYQTTGAIHDVRYYEGGSEEDRLYSDKELLNNMLLEWADEWGILRWLRPRAYRDRALIIAAYKAVRAGGAKYFSKPDKETNK